MWEFWKAYWLVIMPLFFVGVSIYQASKKTDKKTLIKKVSIYVGVAIPVLVLITYILYNYS
ncbi:hypothetical protein [Marininema halotolerans]|uniref:Uncharacterized protein n=1 Tax=Marininema halotolerans TaxID=1155944 RepID=A0A1I6R740_9BACL|nr:hypothetical protein [Marininema halotolerans]SFS60496.1 hypothetical protein SAMN05444972_104204 [Marininema halotolerans]